MLQSFNPMIPYFENMKRVSANITPYGEVGNYTADMFLSDFPQFYNKGTAEEVDPETGETTTVITYTPLVPQNMLDMFIQQANESIIPSRWGTQWRYAAGLFVAHWSALYLKTYSDGSPNAQVVASAADQKGNVSSATMGDTSISYDNKAVNEGTAKWGTWNATQYGAQLATMARMIGIGGMYVI
jgi:hypothetical protein